VYHFNKQNFLFADFHNEYKILHSGLNYSTAQLKTRLFDKYIDKSVIFVVYYKKSNNQY
jgi:hypothetical protein